jgi:hypothetical protein
MMRVVEGIEIRPAHVERDAASIRSLDTSFETGAILDVQADGRGFRLVEKTIEPPLSKAFDLGRLDAAHEWERVWLARRVANLNDLPAVSAEVWPPGSERRPAANTSGRASTSCSRGRGWSSTTTCSAKSCSWSSEQRWRSGLLPAGAN